LANIAEITLNDRIGLSWLDGPSNGGTSVIDYQVWSDDAAGDGIYIELVSALTLREYTSTSLYSGSTYSFKVKARNDIGYSELSESFEILAAQIPDIPSAPTTTILDRWNVVIDW
jgi:hypothetical protein